MTPFTIFWALAACISHSFNILLVYVIISEPLDKMFGLRRYLFNFTVTEFWFTFVLAWGVKPEFLIPMPLMNMTGFFKFFPGECKWIVAFLMIMPLVALCYSFTELCVMRSLILLGQASRVRLLSGKIRYIFLPFIYTMISLVFLSSFYYFRLNKDGLRPLAKDAVLATIYSEINEETDMVYIFNTFHPSIHLYSFGTALTALLVSPGLIIFIYATYRLSDIGNNRNFSTENLKLQKYITFLLVIQCIILQTCVTLPIIGVIALCSFYKPTDNLLEMLKYVGSGLILLHPVYITIITLWMVIPYRLFVRMTLFSILPKRCLPDTRTTVTPIRWQVHQETQLSFNHIRRLSEVNAQRIRAATAPVRATYLRYE